MKKTGILFLVVCLLISILPVKAFATNQDQSLSVMSGAHSLDAMAPMMGSEKLISNCATAFLYEIDSQTLMYSWNPDEKIFPASFVKIMTAMIAIERGNLSDLVIITSDMISTMTVSSIHFLSR